MNQVIPHPNRKLTPRQVLNIRSSSLSNKKIAKKYKLTTGVIFRLRAGYSYKDCGWPTEPPQRHPVGIGVGRKLTDEQVRQIRIDVRTARYKDVAAKYNVDPTTVSNIMRGKTYRSVI